MSFSRTVDIVVSADLDPIAAARDFANKARDGIAADVAAGTFPSRYKTFVDGRAGAAETSVQPGGVIAYEGGFDFEVVDFALQFLRARSPTGSGKGRSYRDSFYVGVNGTFSTWDNWDPKGVPEGAEIVIGNTRPYSRKVDVQQIGLRRLKFSTAPNLFADAVRAINGQFSNFVTAKRVYTYSFPGQYRLKQPQMRSDRPRRVKRRAGEFVESPALVIKPR